MAALGLGLAVAGCVSQPDDQTDPADGSDEQSIVGGAVTSAFPQVGMVGVSNSEMLCSGFLISPTIVLTAAHCVPTAGAAYGFYTGVGSLTTTATVTKALLESLPNVVEHAVSESHPFPGANLGASPYQNDIAYVRLAQPITNVAPLPLGAPTGSGTSCTGVGYGWSSLSSPTGLQAKSATELVEAITGNEIDVTYGSGIANRGDSGGPLICNGAAVGVFSWIDNYASATALRRYTRIEGGAWTWINGVLGADRTLMIDLGRPPAVILGGKRIQIESMALAEMFSNVQVLVDDDAYFAVPYAGSIVIGQQVIGAPGQPGAFTSDTGTIFPVSCLAAVSTNQSSITMEPLAQYEAHTFGPPMFCN